MPRINEIARSVGPVAAVALLLCGGCAGVTDTNVVVSSSSAPTYEHAKYGAEPKRETYVVMPGNYFPGSIVDRSLDSLQFRDLAQILAPELARRQFFPAPDLASADLILVVHWGVTSPTAKMDQLFARDPPSLAEQTGRDPNSGTDFHPHSFNQEGEVEVNLGDADIQTAFRDVTPYSTMEVGHHVSESAVDALASRLRQADTIQLLGYRRDMTKFQSHPVMSTDEETLRSDLETERYFVVLQAYDLHQMRERKPRLVWSLHLNMRCAGNRFPEAVMAMSTVAGKFAGHNLDHVATEEPSLRIGHVDIGEIKIVHDK